MLLLGNRLKAALLLYQVSINWEKQVNIQVRCMIQPQYTLKFLNHLQQLVRRHEWCTCLRVVRAHV